MISSGGCISIPTAPPRIILATAALWFAFLVATWHLDRDSLWDDEGWSLYAVQPPDSAEMLARVRADVHPPLYFALLDAWVNLAGESAYAARLLSVFCGMIALAGTYALGNQFFNAWTGLAALLILGTAGFFVYYTREARMYTLLLMWGVLATWAYWRWRANRTWRRGGLYGVLLAALLYTHYSGVLIMLTHLLHLFFEPQRAQRAQRAQRRIKNITQRRRGSEVQRNTEKDILEPQRTQRATEGKRDMAADGMAGLGAVDMQKPAPTESSRLLIFAPLRFLIFSLRSPRSLRFKNPLCSSVFSVVQKYLFPYLFASFLYLPWIPILAAQFRLHEGRPLALAVPTDAESVWTLIGVATGAMPLLFGLLIAGGVILGWRRAGAQIRLLLLWMIVTPAGLMLLNVGVSPVYQVRYTIALLPAVALLAGWGINALTQRRKDAKAQRQKILLNHREHRGTQRKNGTRVQSEWLGWARRTCKSMSLQSLRVSMPLHPCASPSFLHALRVLCGSKTPLWRSVFSVVQIFAFLRLCVLFFLIVMQFLNYGVYWKPKSRYAEASAQLTAARAPDEPLIADIYWAGVMAYYDRQDGIRRGTVLDVTRAPQTAAEARDMVAAINPADSVWVVMPTNVPRTWDVVAALHERRGVGYRDTVMNMLFYRFDPISASAFRFRFGDMVRFDGSITGRFTARRGQPLCVNMPLTALAPLDERYSVSVQLLDVERNIMAAWDHGLGSPDIDQPFQLEPCLDVPDDLPDGDYYLQLALYDWRTLARLPLIEADHLYWGDALLLGHVALEP
jgi:hypothetical protein